MITVTIKRNQVDRIVAFNAKGHAEYDEHGHDIVCAAVSAILQTAIFGLTENLSLDVEVKTDDGWLDCNLAEYASKKEVGLILEVMVTGLQKTEESYPDNLKIQEAEEEGGRNDA
ncbi:MAG: hypothetical protein AWU54_881 [Candidatus Frackibacter sp. T328-2]|nr:MAG: hypothetical protein AWU54_881 [Candidatus Frackibacter sp. T328-2]